MKGFYALSTSMDTLRLIYCNVGRTRENAKGFFPFEQVRDIIDIARSISYAKKPTPQERSDAKQAINIIFQSLRHSIQAEASASTPDHPILHNSKYRDSYIEEIKQKIGIGLLQIREDNKREDYFSSREKQ